MATPAATLAILVEANTGPANAALAKTDAQLRGTAAAASSTTTASAKAGSALRKMGTAAKWTGLALGAAFVVTAKKSIDTTQELTKSTITLHKNLGIANKQASEWGAVARARGVDSTKLGMAFKTLSTQVQSANDGSATSVKMFKQLGISQKELVKGSKDVSGLTLQIADGMDKLGAGTERTAITGKLFGRGWATIAPLMRDGADALRENLDAADKYGATLHGKTLKAQQELLANTRESKIAWMGLQVSLAKFVTPALNKAEDQFQKIARIMNDPKLTSDEKFAKVSKLIEDDFNKVLDFTTEHVLPEMISAAGNAGPKIAEAIVEGFLHADALGKLVVGGWLITKLGGWGAIGALGKAIGARMGIGIAAGEAAGIGAGAGIGGGLTMIGAGAAGAAGPAGLSLVGGAEGGLLAGGLGTAAAIGLPVGMTAVAATTKGGLIDTAQGHGVDSPALGMIQGIIDKYGSLNKAARHMTDEQKKSWVALAQSTADSGQVSQRSVDWMKATILDDTWKIRKAVRVTGDAFKTDWRDVIQKASHDAADGVDSASHKMVHSVEAMERATKKFAEGVKTDYKSAANAAINGISIISGATNNALNALGVKEVNFAASTAAKGVGKAKGKQRGGTIEGIGDGDKVHVMAEPGEGFINKKAVQKMGGPKVIDAINKAAPRFAKGGTVKGGGLDFALGPYTVPPISYDPAHAGGNSHVHISAFSIPWLLGVGHKIQQMGNSVGEFQPTSAGNPYHFGPVTTSAHAHYPTDHYSGHAVDVNSLKGAESKSWVAAIANVLSGGAGAAAAEKIKRVLLSGPNGALKSMGQGALDHVWHAANKYLGKQQPKMTMGKDVAAKGSYDKAALVQLWSQTGGNGNPNLMAAIGMAESGGNPRAVSSAGARGLWQVMPFWGGGDKLFDPAYNAKKAHMILGQQGLGAWSAYTNGAYQQYLQRGGMVPWHGAGTDFVAHRPQVIGVGDGGPERVQVTPVHGGGGKQALVGRLRITNWDTGMAHFEGQIEDALDGREAHDGQLERMNR